MVVRILFNAAYTYALNCILQLVHFKATHFLLIDRGGAVLCHKPKAKTSVGRMLVSQYRCYLARWQHDGISTLSPTAFTDCLQRPSLCTVIWTVCNCQRCSVTPLGSADNRTLVSSVIEEFWVQMCGRKNPLKRVFRKAAHAAVTHRFSCRGGVAQKCGRCWKLT